MKHSHLLTNALVECHDILAEGDEALTINPSKMKDKTDTHFSKPFLDHVGESVALDPATKALVASKSWLMTFNKGEALLHAGEVCKYVYFILSGEAISYFNDYRGKTTTFFFYFNLPVSHIKNFFPVDYKSFLSAQPASMSIYALSAIKAIRFSKEDVDHMMEHSTIFEKWMRTVDERVYSAIFDRVFSLLTLSATDRYENFLREEPYLLNIFSNYHIASYLGIAPQSLSRIRNKIADR
jgi:CRP-like cAMP-binding protein